MAHSLSTSLAEYNTSGLFPGDPVAPGLLSATGYITSVAGTLLATIGAYYEADAAKDQFQSQALTADFEASQSRLNAKAAEADAQQIIEAGKVDIGLSGLQYGEAKAQERASTGARNIQGGVGSAAEVQASIEIARRIDAQRININTVRAANAARIQAQNARTQSSLATISGRNLRSSARSISPGLAAGTRLLGGVSSVLNQIDRTNYYRRN